MSHPSYVRPKTVTEAVGALQESPTGRLLAGGTDLMVQMRLGHRRPDLVVDTRDLEELHHVEAGDPTVIGAAVTLREFLNDKLLVAQYPALAQAANLLGGRQIQAVATIGGNVCNASPAAETTTPLLAYHAHAQIAGPEECREVALADFFAGPGRTNLAPEELLVSLRLPAVRGDERSAYRRMELRRSVDIAIVSTSAWFRISDGRVADVRVAIGAVTAVAQRVPDAEAALLGLDITDPSIVRAAIADAAASCRRASRPIDDTRATAQYRSAMIEVIAQRTITAALEH